MEYQPHSAIPPLADSPTLSLETRIAFLARRLWEEYGRPDDRDVAIWMEAERQILRVMENVSEMAFAVVPNFNRRTSRP